MEKEYWLEKITSMIKGNIFTSNEINCFCLYFLDGLTQCEISHIMNFSQTYVNKCLKSAKLKVDKILFKESHQIILFNI